MLFYTFLSSRCDHLFYKRNSYSGRNLYFTLSEALLSQVFSSRSNRISNRFSSVKKSRLTVREILNAPRTPTPYSKAFYFGSPYFQPSPSLGFRAYGPAIRPYKVCSKVIFFFP